MILEFVTLLFKLLIAHAVCDFALQTPEIAAGKNRNRKIDPSKVPPGQKIVTLWFYYLTAHALMHAGGALIATGKLMPAVVMLVTHWLIDFMKCENITNPHHDQAMHVIVMAGISAGMVFYA